MTSNQLGRSSRSTNGKIHMYHYGTTQRCNYSGQIRRISARSTVAAAEVTPANACGRCFDLDEKSLTVQEQAARFVGTNA